MDIITELRETQALTDKFFDLPLSDLSKTYDIGKWSIRRILVHLSDAESVLHERIKRVIAEPRQVLWAFDQDLWCEHLQYDDFPLSVSRSLYNANRNSVIVLAERFYLTMGQKTFVHNQTGLRTLKQEFDKVADHNRAHIRQIELALSKQ